MAVTMPPALEAKDLYRFYHADEDEILALRGVSVALQPGELVAVIGPSGSGKSTLLNCLAGLDEPDGGWVAVGGERMTHRPEHERARLRARKIGMMLQSGGLLPDCSVLNNLLIAMALTGVVQRSKARAVLHAVGLAHRLDARPAQLSGGEAARAGLALALVNDPVVLLADEPTGELDRESEALVLSLIQERCANGVAILVVTHNPAIAAAASRVLVLTDGILHDA
jgi:putative ABC transport system ATP-binding protein